MKNLYLGVMRFMNDEEGVTAIEYGLIAALIAIVIIVAVAAAGKEVCLTFKKVADAIGGVSGITCPT
ncbi:MAG: pilus assembly protein [Methylotenera sp. RIFCSPLOWO2_02_FULL_45_14]|nr:MAG: pilus assembly protein [Methylotenera sp. RIFCSPLOWO2_02_FULL_45_14]